MKDLNKSVNEIRQEAMSMLDTVQAVRGERHADVVRILLHVKQAVQLFGTICHEAGEAMGTEEARNVTAKSADVMADLLSQIAIGAFHIAEVKEAEWREAIKDCDTLLGNVDSLFNSALEAHGMGKKFGGRNAR